MENLTDLSTPDLMNTYDEVLRRHHEQGPPAGLIDSLRDALIKRATTKRLLREAERMDFDGVCDTLEQLIDARTNHGAHADPSWGVSVRVLMQRLGDLSPAARSAVEHYDGITHENPVEAALAAARPPRTDTDHTQGAHD